MAGQEQDIVSTEWLNANLNKSDIVVLDVTWFSAKDASEDYTKCHIPGAVFFDLFKNVKNTDLYPRNLPDATVFQQNAQDAGVNNDSHVIVYDSEARNGFFLGSRAWFTFKHFGHEKVSVLDGGLQKWMKDGFATTSEVPTPKKGNFVAKVHPTLMKKVDFMRQNLQDKTTQVLDSRPGEAYKGKPEDAKSGHYPGAISIPFASNLLDNNSGTLKSQSDLQKVFMEHGVAMDKPVVTMCNSGMSSCSLLLAAKVAGLKDISIYQAGFTEWKAQASDADIEQS